MDKRGWGGHKTEAGLQVAAESEKHCQDMKEEKGAEEERRKHERG